MDQVGRVRVPLDKLRLGAKSSFDIHDSDGLLLLGRGNPLTALIRDQILQRGTSFLEVHPDDVAALTGTAAPEARRSTPANANETLAARRIEHGDEPYSAQRASRFQEKMSSAIDSISRLGQQIESPSRSDLSAMCEIVNEFAEMLLEDADQSISAVDAVPRSIPLARRCAQMSLLAINTGIELDLSDREVIQLGTAGLLHDLGLYVLPTKFRNSAATLTSEETWDYRRHPTLTSEILSNYSSVSDEVRLIASQVHESPDGSGFPRGLTANVIHPLAGTLNLIDAYLCLIEPGPGRPAVLPHDAIGFLLHSGGQGQFDVKTMRAFLNQMTLFPIGSEVELDNGDRATVIRRDGNHYATPVVHVNDAPDEDTLALRNHSRKIARPATSESMRQMRITADMMSSLSMQMLQPGY